MMNVKNEAQLTSVKCFFTAPSGSFFLFGPRGTGKSTWLRDHFGDAIRLDLLDRETFRLYTARPERLRDLVRAQAEPRCIVLDEVQKILELLDVVHRERGLERSLRTLDPDSSSSVSGACPFNRRL